MGRRFGSRCLVALLLTLFASAAEITPASVLREASALVDRGKWKDAAPLIESGLARFSGIDDDDVWRLRILQGRVFTGLSQSKQALAAVAPELPPRLRADTIAVHRLRVMSIASFMLHDDASARKFFNQARRLAMAHHPEMAATIASIPLNMPTIFTVAERRAAFLEASRYLRRYPDPAREAQLGATVGYMYAGDDRFDEAINAYEAALRVAEASHLDARVQAIKGNLGWCYSSLGDDEQAEIYLREALESARKLGANGDLIPWHLLLGGIAFNRQDYTTAVAEYQQGLVLANQFNRDKRGPALANLAVVALAMHNLDDARRFNTDAITAKRESKDVTGVLRSRILNASIERQARHLEEARRVLELVIGEAESRFIRFEAEAELARVALARNDSELANQHFQRALATIDDARGEVKDEELRLSFSNISASLYRDYVDFLAGVGRAREALRVVELSRARTLAEGLNVEHDRSDDLDPEKIARAAKVTVLSYWITSSRSFVFVVTPDGVNQFSLPPAKELNAEVEAYQSDLLSSRGTLEGSGARGERLFATLIPPAAASLLGKRIMIIPDGRLADPEYKPLPHAAEEIANIQKYFDRHTTLAGPRATPGAYAKAALEPYAFIHFVAHGVATRLRPLDSAIILGRDQVGYKLYARNIVDHPLKARLVTISSCHGAGRRAFTGEGLVGLAWAFLRAGAHEVVAALWQVDDASTVKLMDHMYAGIHAGRPPVDALHEAKLKLLHSRSVWRKPQYWAPFVLYSGS